MNCATQACAAAPPRAGWRYFALDLRPVPHSVTCARRHARQVLTAWRLADVADDGELIVSELVTNAIRAVATITKPGVLPSVRLRMTGQDSAVHIAVWDADDALARPAEAPALDAASGRGLAIVEALSHRWGWQPAADGGKVIWALLSAPSPRSGGAE